MRTLIRLYWLLLPAASYAGVEEALRYLEEEVPRWRRENGCFSCHNNGDGVRALMLARTAGLQVDNKAFADSLEWLATPSQWEPKALARVQVSATLVVALKANLIQDRTPLFEAAKLLAADQSPDGSWKVEADGTLGSAATYGPYLATYLAQAALREADARHYAPNIERAGRWFASQKPENPLDASAYFLATGDPAALELVLNTQTASGSWVNEPFDTAIAMLALSTVPHRAEVEARIQRAKAWLLNSQLSGGGWPGTTRPGGGNSYAQHISTSAWAAIALIGGKL